jgi:hypothetical protein
MTYADLLEQAHFRSMHDNYFWREIRAESRSQTIKDLADQIAEDVLHPSADNAHRRAAWLDEQASDDTELFLRDLLDDVAAGVNPTDAIKRRIANWALGVAEYEVERCEHD